MSQNNANRPPPGLAVSKHGARNCAYLNAFLWGIGNGLFSTTLIVYMISDICKGEMSRIAIHSVTAWVIAAPRIAGLLRLLTPMLLDFCGNRKSFAIVCYAISPCVLALIPLLIAKLVDERKLDTSEILAFLVVVWCLYHLVENFGTIAFLSWMGEMNDTRIQGRFLGVRERWMVGGVSIGVAITGIYTSGTFGWKAYLQPTYWGILFLFLSVLPLFWMPEIPWRKLLTDSWKPRFEQIISPFRIKGFSALLFLGCWIQFSLGISQSAQFHFQKNILGLTLLCGLVLQLTTRTGQLVIAPCSGKKIDVFGAFPVLLICLSVVAMGSFIQIAATPESWWLTFTVAIIWIGWIGVNIGLPKILFQISPGHAKSAPIAVYFTFTTLSFGLATLLGGYLADEYGNIDFAIPLSGLSLDYTRFNLFSGGVLRLLSVGILFLVFNRITQPRQRNDS